MNEINEIELLRVLQGIKEELRGTREELIKIGEIIQDTALPRATTINVRRSK